jgi:hypothetical protein
MTTSKDVATMMVDERSVFADVLCGAANDTSDVSLAVMWRSY